MTSSNSLTHKVKKYENYYAQWERERADYIAMHGLAAWDAKVEQELKDLYPEET